MMRRELVLVLVLVLCGGGAGLGGRWVATDSRGLKGEALLQCVRSVMERTDHGDEPTHADRVFYSHRRYFGRQWAADYLLSRQYAIKYFQIPKSGSTEIRTRMSWQFDIPYDKGYRRPGKHYKFPGNSGGTLDRNRVKPESLSGEALEYFTFTMVAEPVIRLVHGIEEAGMGQKLHRRPSPRHVGQFVARYLRVLIEQDRDPTGNWTFAPGKAAPVLRMFPHKRGESHNVHVAGQVTLLMDMFLAATPPKLDFVGGVEQLDVAWNRTLQAYKQYNTQHSVQVDPERYTPKPAKARAPGGSKAHDQAEMWAVLHRDPQLLCDAARMLEFDYECLPTYTIARWCGGNTTNPILA